jgi:hypothetical protein
MFINTTKSVFSRMSVELGRRSKDVIAIAGDRDSAEAAAESIRQEIEFRDNIQTGALLNSISVTPAGGAAAQLDNYDVDVVI